MIPLEQIDFVFFFIRSREQLSASWSNEYIWNLYISKTPEAGINRTLFEEIIKQLVEDDYIREAPINDSPQKTYHVTFKGRLFKGYVAYQNSLEENNKRISDLEKENRKFQEMTLKNSRYLNRLTFILAFGTGIAALFYLFEILNHWLCIYPIK